MGLWGSGVETLWINEIQRFSIHIHQSVTLPSGSCPLLGSAVGRRLVVLGLVVPPVPELILAFNVNFRYSLICFGCAVVLSIMKVLFL